MRARRPLYFAVAAAAAAIGIGAKLWLDERRGAAAPEVGGYVLERPRRLPPLTLVDEHDAPFRSADFAGRWSFLYFGFTYCPDVCPLTLVQLAETKRLLAAQHARESVAYYFVSVDPRRDTPARLREYVAYFDEEFRGLTGSEEMLAALAEATETVFDVPESPPDDNYLVSHSSNLVLLDPNGAVHAVLQPPHDAARLAADFAAIAAEHAGAR